MLNKIKIENFQSHENTEIDLSSGVNIIHGLSQAGKTAIFRALNWVFFNRPSGFHFHSSFATKPYTKVSLLFDNARISFQKTEKTATYFLETKDGYKEFSVVGTSVPEEIQRVLNISEINIANQLDNPFFILNSPGEIGRIFNSITNSEKADEFVSTLTSFINRRKTYISTLETQANELQQQVDAIAKIEKFDKDFKRYSFLQEKEYSLNNDIQKIKEKMKLLDKKQKFILRIDVQLLDTMVQSLSRIESQVTSNLNKINHLKSLFDRLQKAQQNTTMFQNKLNKMGHVVKLYEDQIEMLSKINMELKQKTELIRDLNLIIDLTNSIDDKHISLKKLKHEYQKELSTTGICPFCFSKINQKTLQENL